MWLTEELRDRGIRRSREEIEDDARRSAFRIIASLPTGRRVTEPAGELSPGEAAVLEEGGLDLSPPVAEEPNPLTRTAVRYAALLDTAITTKGAAGLLRIDEGRVLQKLQDKTLYGVNAGREIRLPAFQFEDGKEVPGIGEVLRHVDGPVHPVALSNWLALPNPDLHLDGGERAVSPREWLLSGGGRGPSCRSPKSSRESPAP